MKLSVLNLLQLASLASAHYTFPALIVGGQTTSNWQYVRMTINRDSTSPVTDVSSSQMTCYTSGIPSTSTANVNAGDTVGFTVNPNIFHPGPLLFYMAKVPDGQSIGSFSGSGAVWFKIYQNDATISGGSISWPMNQNTVSVRIPSCIPSGQYLLRVEHIALHSASSVGGAQLYIACGQLNVSGGGSTPGGPTVSFPGAYSATDPGILINMYGNPRSYTPPGPAVFSCSGNNGSGGTTTARTSSTTTTTSRQATTATTTLRTTTTSARTTTTAATTNSGGTQAKWGQCGGSGWTGPTVCQSGSTCVVQNSYYSQCQ